MKSALSVTLTRKGCKHLMELHKKIEKVRESKGVTKTFIARKCGRTPTWYTDISNGRRGVSVEALKQIANALDVDIRIFFSDELSDSHKNNEKVV